MVMLSLFCCVTATGGQYCLLLLVSMSFSGDRESVQGFELPSLVSLISANARTKII